MSKSKELREFDRGSIVGCYFCGKSVREIADILHKPKSTGSDVIVKWKRRGSETAEKRTGWPKILGERSRRTPKRVVKQNRKSSLVEISQEFQSSSGICVSSRTVRRESHRPWTVAYHRSQYSRYSAIYTDGSKRADYVGCGVVIEDIMHGYRLDTSCSIFTAEAVAIYRALQLIDSTMPRKYCIYTDSMSVLEAFENYHDRCHPVVCTILDITSRLYSKGFDIVFCWLPSHVGIIGNEQADSAAKSATTHLPLAVPLSDMKRVIMHHIFKIWQESWSQQLDNKLHSVKPVIGAWPVMPMRRTDVKLTRLRIGHTRFTHRHLLFGERAPECPSCHVSYTVHHILIDCPVFNTHRMTFFHKSVLTLSDLVGEIPHQNLFAFIRRLGFLYLI
ncbi:RNase H domain-containing protein [Trichonephila clavipes]|nr:RNase H domain-containing protein [Trichonephila clavipes]